MHKLNSQSQRSICTERAHKTIEITSILAILCTLLCYSCCILASFLSAILFVRDMIVNMVHRFSERRNELFLVVFSGDWVSTNEHFVTSVPLEFKVAIFE